MQDLIEFVKPSGAVVWVNPGRDTVVYAESLGWVRRGELAPEPPKSPPVPVEPPSATTPAATAPDAPTPPVAPPKRTRRVV
jgi:hypothetical protein